MDISRLGTAPGIVCGVLAALCTQSPSAAAQVGDRDPGAVDSTTEATPLPPVAEALAGFHGFAASVIAEWQLPGLAVGVVRGSDVVLAQGYGYRDLESRLPVTEHTVMPIGSNTKSFTATLLAMLVDEGAIEWDRPVRDYLPDFELRDDFATAEMTARDLLTHQSGLPRHDHVWYGRPVTRSELFRRLQHLEPNASFRSRFQYQNLMFMAAGHLAERVAGVDWGQMVEERIFRPLGMTRSSTSVAEIAAAGDYALPYLLTDGELERVAFRDMDAIGPAGAINSNVVEMLAYIQMHLDGGVFAGRRLLSAGSSALMQRPHSAIPGSSEHGEVGQSSYGLGVQVGSYRGRAMVTHGGGVDGFASAVSWLPQERIGVIVLTNRSGGANPAPTIVTYNLFDRLLGLPGIDWSERSRELHAEQRSHAAESAEEDRERGTQGTHPSRELGAYVGHYSHPAYGTMEVRIAAGAKRLEIAYDEFRLGLEHRQDDTFHISSRPALLAVSGLVTFSVDETGTVATVAIPFEPNGADIVFEKGQLARPGRGQPGPQANRKTVTGSGYLCHM